MKHLLTIALLTSPIMLFAQLGRDSVLLNERSIDRPLIVHDRQLRITSGYSFSTITSRFDDNGDKIKLSNDGRANFRQSLLLDVKYGFRELVQLNVALNYISNTLREQPISIIATPGASIDETHRVNGFEDIFVGVDFLVPWGIKR